MSHIAGLAATQAKSQGKAALAARAQLHAARWSMQRTGSATGSRQLLATEPYLGCKRAVWRSSDRQRRAKPRRDTAEDSWMLTIAPVWLRSLSCLQEEVRHSDKPQRAQQRRGAGSFFDAFQLFVVTLSLAQACGAVSQCMLSPVTRCNVVSASVGQYGV
ncbi:hypothetical protein sr00796 [Sporisorium reilianum SRZ2]|uniref:Uncharacterized protein n=1 Tax=Sporisorium reilianum (strain SRZ2) TaxID=999809 RepID=E7A382_SPORE|nr:hypothetical protein sr00796 [Sporisorium reilianum SRZ2]